MAMKRPARRPSWLGAYQPWPCGDCGREMEKGELHECVPGESNHPDEGQEPSPGTSHNPAPSALPVERA